MKKEKEDYAVELQRAYDRRESIYKFGASDPFHSDGLNANLCRNHILYYRNLIEESCEEYPPIYYREIPPELDRDYMARPDEIRLAAKRAYGMYLASESLAYLKNTIRPEAIEPRVYASVLGWAESLARAIEEDDLVTMRRHEHPDNYLQEFEDFAARVKSLKEKERSLF
jgi:hypothetical protein